MTRTATACASVAFLVVACHRATSGEGDGKAPVRPLAAFATQRLVVAPTSHARAADSLGWIAQLTGVRGAARRLDSSLAVALNARGLASRWILPPALARAYERNRSYATDPYQLAVEQVRALSFKAGEKYGEPLSSQLRTMIALEEDARFVLIPVDLRFERVGEGGRAVARFVLLDPRFAEARWVGDITGAAVQTPTLALDSVADRLADLFVAP